MFKWFMKTFRHCHYASVTERSGILSLSGRAFRVHNIYFDTRSISKWEIAIKDMTDFQKFQKRIRRGARSGRRETA
jgi:hypothetical protein